MTFSSSYQSICNNITECMLVEIAILHSHDVRQVRNQSSTVMFTCQIFAVLFFLAY